MAITRKPAETATSAPSEEEIQKILSKGLGTVSTAAAEEPAATPGVAKVHPLRFPPDGVLYSRLEKALLRATVKLPRNTFILQAIAEKLERDGSD